MSKGSPSGRRWQRFRLVVFSTYGRTCHLCQHDGANQVDHVISVLERPDLAWSLDNCKPAHGARNRCPTCGRCCNQARIAGPKRPQANGGPVKPQLSGTVTPVRPRRSPGTPHEVVTGYRTSVVIADQDRCQECQEKAVQFGVFPSRCWGGTCGDNGGLTCGV